MSTRTGTVQTLDRIQHRLTQRDQTLLFVDGNHEDFTRLTRYPLAGDGIRWVRSRIGHLPRGYRTRLASGRVLAAFGGAASIDLHHRTPGRDWWAAELTTEEDLHTLGHDPVDVLIGHEAPAPLPALDRILTHTDPDWPAESLAYAARGRELFTRGFLQVRPTVYLGGHYHRYLHTRAEYLDGDERFTCRVTLLDMNGTDDSVTILDTGTFAQQTLTRAGRVHRLTGNEAGTWIVTTQHSQYRIDFNTGTIQRTPGPDASPKITDGPRRLRSITDCHIGARAYLTLHGGGYLTDHEWHHTSIIQHIQREPGRITPTRGGTEGDRPGR